MLGDSDGMSWGKIDASADSRTNFLSTMPARRQKVLLLSRTLDHCIFKHMLHIMHWYKISTFTVCFNKNTIESDAVFLHDVKWSWDYKMQIVKNDFVAISIIIY